MENDIEQAKTELRLALMENRLNAAKRTVALLVQEFSQLEHLVFEAETNYQLDNIDIYIKQTILNTLPGYLNSLVECAKDIQNTSKLIALRPTKTLQEKGL